jgi:peptidoglycan hydrolase-like protein with peptidoglycan-binding domain
MNTWWGATALFVVSAMLAGSAYAQTPPSSGATKSKDTPGAAPKSDSTKSDSMKSDSTKSDSMKSSGKSDTSSSMKGHDGMAGGKQEQVKAAQQALKDKGHDPGAADGVMGPKTQAALRDFQSKEGLKATGRLDRDTMSKLGVEAKAGAAADTSRGAPAASPGSGSTGATPGGATGKK